MSSKNRKWSKDEDERLMNGIKAVYPEYWETVVKKYEQIRDFGKNDTKTTTAFITTTTAPTEDTSDSKKRRRPFGIKWKHVYEVVGTRTARQCEMRWNNHLDPFRIALDWTIEEEDRLYNLYQTFGEDWSAISKNYHARNVASLKHLWKTKHKQIEKRHQSRMFWSAAVDESLGY
jgi:hypothetical protein